MGNQKLLLNDGFTLVEVMLAIVILTIAFIPILYYYSSSIKIVHQTEIRSQAIKLARDYMEIIKSEAATDWENLYNFTEKLKIDDISSDYNLLAKDYKLDVTFSGYDFNGDGDSTNDGNIGKKVTVKITWENGTRELKLETLISKR